MSRAFAEREAPPVAHEDHECASCEAPADHDEMLCADCLAMVRISGGHPMVCRCGICTLGGAAQWAERDARGAA